MADAYDIALARVPGLGGYIASQNLRQRQGMGELQQAGALQGILMKNRAMQQEQEIKGILAQAAQQSGGDPAKLSQTLLQSGHPEAMSLGIKLKDMMPKPEGDRVVAPGASIVGPNGMVKYTAPAKEQNPSNLSRLLAERDALPQGDPRRVSYDNAIRKESEVSGQIVPKIVNEAPVTSIVVQDKESPTGWSYRDGRTGRELSKGAPPPAGDPGRAYNNNVAGGAGKDDLAQHDAAIAASATLPQINNLVSTLKNSQAITGMGADILKNVERAKVLIANDKAAGKKVSDTEYLDALMGSEVFSMIKPLGIGARGLDTPAEREFLRKVMTGEISLNRDTLLRMAETRRAITERSIQRWNSRVKSGQLDRYFDASGRPKTEIDVSQEPLVPTPTPAPAAPSGGGGWKIRPL